MGCTSMDMNPESFLFWRVSIAWEGRRSSEMDHITSIMACLFHIIVRTLIAGVINGEYGRYVRNVTNKTSISRVMESTTWICFKIRRMLRFFKRERKRSKSRYSFERALQFELFFWGGLSKVIPLHSIAEQNLSITPKCVIF